MKQKSAKADSKLTLAAKSGKDALLEEMKKSEVKGADTKAARLPVQGNRNPAAADHSKDKTWADIDGEQVECKD